jgi:glycosyltransferase involved in cell wall biosynthesis
MINELFPDYSNTPSKHAHFHYERPALKGTSDTPPVVTVVTPLYNTGSIFHETIDCILSQSFQNFEWLIVDDGSSHPETIDLLSKLEALDNRIKVIRHGVNKGLSASRNTGVKNAKSEFVFFIDSDDLLELTALEKFYNFLRINTEFDFVNSYVVGFGHLTYLWKGNFSETAKFFSENPITATFMARKEVFKTVPFDESMRGGFEDWDFWVRAAVNGKWGHTIPEFLFWYRRSDPGLKKWENWDNGPKTTQFVKRLHEKYFPQIGDKGFPVKSLNTFRNEVLHDKDLTANNSLAKKKKRILFILPWFNLGGADKVNLDILEGLVTKFDWEATILSTLQSTNEWLPMFDRVSPDIFNLPNYFSPHDYYRYVDYLIKTRQPDVILVTHSQFGYWMCPHFKQNYPQIPVVDFLHVESPGWEDGWGYPRMSTLMAGCIDKTFVTSYQLKFWLQKAHNRNMDNLEVVYINVDSNIWKHKPENKIRIKEKQWNLESDLPIILFAGRIDQQKQPLVIVQSIMHLYKKTDKFRFVLIGDGPDMALMKQEIARCGLEGTDRIWCLGSLKNEQVAEYLDAADIFFLPSEYEGISLAIFEAMAKELAIVAADVGGQKELVTADCGVLVKRSNPDQESRLYADVLYRLISDNELLTSMKKASRRRIKKHFELSKMISHVNTALTSPIVTKENYKVTFEYQALLSKFLSLNQ